MAQLGMFILALQAGTCAAEMPLDKTFELVKMAVYSDPTCDPVPWNREECGAEGYPSWYEGALSENGGDELEKESAEETRKHGCGAPAGKGGEAQPVPLPDESPKHADAPILVDRLGPGDATPREIFERYIRFGLPFVITNPFDEAGREAMRFLVPTLNQTALDQYAGESPDGAELLQREPSVDTGFHMCRECRGKFQDIIGVAPFIKHRPWFLRYPEPLEFSNPFDQASNSPHVMWGRYHFGKPNHFDLACHATISLQLLGRKVWWVWAPWDSVLPNGTTLRAHTAFEATLEPGDMFIYGPGWYHETDTLGTLSLASAHYMRNPPFYAGALPDGWTGDPRGFRSCLEGRPWRGETGWRERDAAWRALLDDPPSKTTVACASRAVRKIFQQRGQELDDDDSDGDDSSITCPYM